MRGYFHALSENAAIQQSIACLAHPISIVSIVVLLLNDHILKWQSPSWWTGKLSDFSGLVFFPFLLAILLAVLIPPRSDQYKKRIGIAAFGLTASLFCLLKVSPAFNAWAVQLSKTIGFPVSIICDPSDVVALPFMLIGWHLWTRSFRHTAPMHHLGRTMLIIGSLASIADQPGPSDSGIGCLYQNETTIIAQASTWRIPPLMFASSDGGVHWEATDPAAKPTTTTHCNGYLALQNNIKTTNAPFLLFRVNGHQLERSDDSGNTWLVDLNWQNLFAEPEYIYRQWKIQGQGSGSYYWPGPKDVLVDPQTGNLIMAMGYDGIWTRKSDGQWLKIGVGPYHWDPPDPLDTPFVLLSSEFWLALAAGALSVTTIADYVNETYGSSFFLSLMWAGWVLTVMVLRPSHYPPGGIGMLDIAGLATLAGDIIGLMIVPGSIVLMAQALFFVYGQSRRAIVNLSAIGLITIALFLIPYLLWVRQVILDYNIAAVIAIALIIIPMIFGHWYLTRIAYVKRKSKKRKPFMAVTTELKEETTPE